MMNKSNANCVAQHRVERNGTFGRGGLCLVQAEYGPFSESPSTGLVFVTSSICFWAGRGGLLTYVQTTSVLFWFVLFRNSWRLFRCV